MGIDIHLIANFAALALITLAGPAVIFLLFYRRGALYARRPGLRTFPARYPLGCRAFDWLFAQTPKGVIDGLWLDFAPNHSPNHGAQQHAEEPLLIAHHPQGKQDGH